MAYRRKSSYSRSRSSGARTRGYARRAPARRSGGMRRASTGRDIRIVIQQPSAGPAAVNPYNGVAVQPAPAPRRAQF